MINLTTDWDGGTGKCYLNGEEISLTAYSILEEYLKDVQKLEQENEGLVSLVDEILNCIPETYLTGYGLVDDSKEVVKLEAIRGEE